MVKLLVLLILAQQSPMTLEDCIREAIVRHPDVAVAKEDIERARAQKLGTRAGYLPRLDLYAQDGYMIMRAEEHQRNPLWDRETDHHSLGLSLSQNIFDGGKWWNQIERADQEISRAEQGAAATLDDVTLRVITAFYELHKSKHQLDVLRESLELSRAQLLFAKERHKLGAASKVDVATAEVSVGEDRIAIERQRGALELAMVELNLAIGRGPAETVATHSAGDEQGSQLGEVQVKVTDKNAKIRQLIAAQQVAQLDVDIAKGDRWPRVTGSISYERQDPEFYKVYSRFDELFNLSFGIRISFPIFDGFLTSSNVEQARVQANRLKAEEQKLRQEIEGGQVRAINNLRRLQTIAKIEASNIKAAEQQLALARERYAVGDGTALEMRDAQLAVTRARLAEVQTKFDFRIERAYYHYAMGDLMETYLPGEKK